jgi:hypothetical protein
VYLSDECLVLFLLQDEERLWNAFETYVLHDKNMEDIPDRMTLELQEVRAELEQLAANQLHHYQFLQNPARL